ncbi:MAG: hypothetical protein F6K40_19170 [Okeania sp. SIO3I5]|uniref:LamG-like jellyroll fold domain-containing protein n=1 Tax=Okeania sp. SIO3I5 TaxID=2607805 RepID=UPI0013BB7184|nr:LamG-like jellyroll fold domain-containing protein [Okeania sp. SIO3I5]NEQ38266.1 hypothetical protein [Okeania sp. SIO3I5]
MSNSQANLVLYLKLDEIVEDGGTKKVIDVSSQTNNGTIQGEPQLVTDETFGSCLSFDGINDYIEISDADEIDFGTNQDFTVESWVKIAASQPDIQNGDNDIIEKWDDNGGYPYVIRYLRNAQQIVVARYDGSKNPGVKSQTQIKHDQFYHIAFVKQGSTLLLYLDGKKENSSEDTTTSETKNSSSLYLGKRGNVGNFFKGNIAHLRIYNKALSPEEIQQDINDDLSAIASFNKTHPLDFNLYDGEDKEPVIFIENDTQGEELILEIVNDSDQAITLPTKSGSVSATNHHFELRFRPDTLSPNSLKQLVLAIKQGWSMSSPVTQDDGKVSLYFLTNNPTLGARGTIPLTLQNINGAAAGGARTSRVELKCPQFTHEGETVSNYYREKRLSIVSHRGKKNIPLHVGFVGSNRILNDRSSANELILRITNVLKDKSIPLNPASQGDEASKLIISFDIDSDWALGTKSQVENITIEGKDWRPNEQPEDDWNIVKGNEGETPTWTITHQNEAESGLAPGQVVQLTISNIVSSLPSGQANLYLRYENIPGYWDGTFVCTIEKSPILYKGKNVGIGTINPQTKLSVNGTTTTNQLSVNGTTTTNQLSVNGTTTTNQLSVNGTTTTNQLSTNQLSVDGTTTTNQLSVDGTTTTNQLSVDGTTTTNQLSVDGTTTTAQLSVKGTTTTNALKLDGHNHQFRMSLDEKNRNLRFEVFYNKFGSFTRVWNKNWHWDDSAGGVISDLSLKTDIKNEGNILSRLMQLDVKNYRWKDNPEDKIKEIGFVAQDVQPLFPALVGEFKDQDADESKLTLKYAQFGVLAVGGLKELKHEKDAEIAQLKTEMKTQIAELKTEMEAEIKALKDQIQQLLRGKE